MKFTVTLISELPSLTRINGTGISLVVLYRENIGEFIHHMRDENTHIEQDYFDYDPSEDSEILMLKKDEPKRKWSYDGEEEETMIKLSDMRKQDKD